MIEFLEETGSTNSDLLDRIKSGERVAEGDWLVARRQTAGRGRQRREWFDGEGNFMGSTVVHYTDRDPPAHTLALASGLVVYEAILPLCPDPAQLMLKWPNDVLLNLAKLCGILLETAGNAIVIGMGVNLAKAPQIQGRATIALSEVTKAPQADEFAEELADCFSAELERWRSYGVDPLLRRWCTAAHPQGTPLKVHDSDGSAIAGQFDGLSEDGSLMLRLDNGETRAINAGDVR
ncbi:MAG TPA: biotin--[acetyl-CoA-carboxylase] ligase, partial [Erythrobacter sp.]|nr:biotin--[acetyl-CoA-carboxylase] ligase [Erythrobacter sp.]